jgi:AraC-like DNA-binding protein
VVRALEARGVDGMALAREAGVDPGTFEVDGGRVPLAASTALWRLAVRTTGDPCFAVSVARFVRPGTFHGLGLGVLASRTLADALTRIGRFAPLVLDTAARPSAEERDGRFVLALGWTSSVAGRPGVPVPESVEAITACIVATARFLTDGAVAPVEVHLPRPDRPEPDGFERYFRCPVRYGADDYLIAYDADRVHRPLRAGCGEAAEAADRVAAGYIARVQGPDGVADEVRTVLRRAVGEGSPTAARVAAELAMSSRTLQRRLQDEGTTFRALVDEVRMARARELLADGTTAAAVATRLGFSDPTAFRRAFKRTTGETPRTFTVRTATREALES